MGAVNFLRYVFRMSEFEEALELGTSELYTDAALYDHEYRRRRVDVNWYRRLARQVAGDTASGSASPDSNTGGAVDSASAPAQKPGAETATTRILELACGSGRLLLPLARDGHTVFGIDRSATMLERCGQRLTRLNARARARVHILEGDIRCSVLDDSHAASFPLIICPFNGFMHLYTREDVERCLAEVRRLLAKDGMFALDISHPDPAWLARDPGRRFARTRVRHPTTGERFIYSTSHAYDPATQMAWIRLYYEPDLGPRDKADRAGEANSAAKEAKTRVITLAQRLFFPAEIEALLHYNGFEILYHAGGFEPGADAGLLTVVSSEQVICARAR